MTDETNLTSQVVRASFWTVASRWSLRAVGFVTLIVMARLLDPADYGVMAMAMAFLALVELFVAWGFDIAIVRHPAPHREHYDTAWTIQLLIGVACAAIVAAAAPAVAMFFNEPRIQPVILVLSISFIFQGATNIGLANLQRNFEFAKEFRFLLLCRGIGFVITIAAALIFRNYWALVIGQLAASLTRLIIGYIFVPMRPRFTLSRSRELIPFSLWLVVRNLAFFVIQRFDTIMISRFYTAEVIGAYDLAKNVSIMAISESLMPLSRALLPGLAKITNDHKRLLATIATATGVYATIALPLGVGLATVSEEFVLVVLGDKWMPAQPFVAAFALGAGVAMLSSALGPLLLVQARTKLIAMMMVVQALLHVGLVLFAVSAGDIVLAAYAMLISIAVTMPFQLKWALGSWSATVPLFRAILRPLLSVLVMAAVVLAIGSAPWEPAVLLAVEVVVGAAVYSAMILFLWFAAGRPDGPESLVKGVLAGVCKRYA